MRIRLIGGGVGGVNVDEELFGIPVEKRTKISVEVEAELRVFLAFGRVIVRPALDAVFEFESVLARVYACGM